MGNDERPQAQYFVQKGRRLRREDADVLADGGQLSGLCLVHLLDCEMQLETTALVPRIEVASRLHGFTVLESH